MSASGLPASLAALSVSVLALALAALRLASLTTLAWGFLALGAALAVSIFAFLCLSSNFLAASLCCHAESLACLLRGLDLRASQLCDKTFLESRLYTG